MNEMKWIPVTESLPEPELTNTHEGDVLLCVRDKNEPEIRDARKVVEETMSIEVF